MNLKNVEIYVRRSINGAKVIVQPSTSSFWFARTNHADRIATLLYIRAKPYIVI